MFYLISAVSTDLLMGVCECVCMCVCVCMYVCVSVCVCVCLYVCVCFLNQCSKLICREESLIGSNPEEYIHTRTHTHPLSHVYK